MDFNIELTLTIIYIIYYIRRLPDKFTRVAFNLKNYIKLNIYNLKVIKHVIRWSEWEVLLCYM